jgi:parvulin-like peptidyl-prolyl isomerase
MNANRDAEMTFNNQKLFIRVLLIICVVAVAIPGVGHGEIVDAVVATVGQEVILHSDLISEVSDYLNDLRSRAASQAEYVQAAEQAMREVLDLAIERKILFREAQLFGLSERIERFEERLQERIDEYKSEYDTNEAFLQMLADAGLTMNDLRERERKRILALSMGSTKRQFFEKEAVISESELAEYFKEHQEIFARPARVRARRIFLGANKSQTERDAVKLRMVSLKKELVAGGDFESVARVHSEGPYADAGGLMPWVAYTPEEPDVVPELFEVLFTLENGQVSEIIEMEWGFTILQVEEKETAQVESFENARTQIEPKLRAEYAEKEYRAWMADLRNRSRIRIFL